MTKARELSDEIRSLLVGTPWGDVYPQRPIPSPLAYDGRSVALRTLKRYLSEIGFRRPGGRDARNEPRKPIAFQIEQRNIHIGWPDYEKGLDFPSLTFLHGAGTYEMIGLTAYIEESTRDQYGPGTVVRWMNEYVETFQIEKWASKRSELRAIIAGIETALSPTEQMYGVRFRMPDYFNQLVRFTPMNRKEFDEPDGSRNRRRAQVEVEMAFHIVSLVNYEMVKPTVKVVVDADLDYNTAVQPEEVGPSTPTKEGPCDPCG